MSNDKKKSLWQAAIALFFAIGIAFFRFVLLGSYWTALYIADILLLVFSAYMYSRCNKKK